MTVTAADVKLDVGRNRLWIDGPGVADTLMQRNLEGQALATPTPVQMGWQGGLTFDGRTVRIQRGVTIDGPDDHVRCNELDARLTANVDFGARVDQNAIAVEEVECRGQVAIDHKSCDEAGVTSYDRMEIEQLAVNQQTGAIRGVGRGVIRSTRFASQLPGLAAPGSGASPLPATDAKLHFLRVDFQEGLTGNLREREIAFLTRVRTVYGPVDAWEQELALDRPELLPPDAITLTSDRLQVSEDPLAARTETPGPAESNGLPIGKVQMVAEGNVRIDGQSPKGGMFSATAERVSYTQSKEQLILEGSNRLPATLSLRDPSTGRQLEIPAGKIIYNTLTGQPELDGARSIEFTPGGGDRPAVKSALGPHAPRQ